MEEELQELLGRLGAVEEERRGLEVRRGELEAIVARLRKERSDAEAAERERRRLEKFQRLLEDVWRILRDLGPRVSTRLLAGITSRANRLFALLQDGPGRLAFAPNYELRFRQADTDLPFANLGGGEQMSAALAIQMAMARDFAGSSFCIFDEPTIHLDPSRNSAERRCLDGARHRAAKAAEACRAVGAIDERYDSQLRAMASRPGPNMSPESRNCGISRLSRPAQAPRPRTADCAFAPSFPATAARARV